MLSPRWRKALRDLGRHSARSLLVALAMALGLTGACTVLNAWALVERATEQGFIASLPVSATITVEGTIDAAAADAARAHPAIGAVRLRRSLVLSAQAQGASHDAIFFAFDDFNAPGIGLLRPEGPWPPRDGEWVIERSSLDFSGATVGDAVTLRPRAAEAQRLALSGVVRDVSQAPGWMDHLVYGYAPPATLQRLGAPAGFDQMQLRVRDGVADRATVRRIAAEAAAMLERHGLHVASVEVPVPGEHVHAAQMNSALMTQGAFGLLALLVCALLVVNLIQSTLAGQAREIGLMKTLGAGPWPIARLYLAQSGMLGLLAALPALPAAVFLGRRYAEFRAEMLNFPLDGHGVPGWVLALELAVALALPVAAAALPVWRTCRVPVGEALRDIGIIASGRALASPRRVAVGGLPRILLLALGNAFRRRQRMLLTLLALAAGGAVYLGAANLRGAVQDSVDLLFEAQHFDLSLRLVDARPAVALETTARAVEGVSHAEAWRSRRATLADNGDDFALIGVPDNSTALQPRLVEGRWLQAGDDTNAAVLSRGLLRQQPQLRLGDQVMLRIDGESRFWTIVGVVDAGPQPVAYTRRARLEALAGDTLAGTIVVALEGNPSDAAQLDAIARLRGALAEAGMPVTSSQRVAENRRAYEDHLLMVVEFLGAMSWLMIAVGAISLASTMGMAVLERRRELGVMRAIGARNSTTMLLVQTEGLIITGLAWLAALPLSVPMSVLLADAFGRVMFPLPTPWWPDAAAALRWLLVMVPVSLLACAWPAWRAARVPVAASLAYEG
ncbi:MAG TPA: ABC transporter permease [Ideonella sp.]|uniref:ABC transporter permease n=1 Tax=Ideonella sp. TaxID=1929293 RepID=UPI002E30DEA0|nr:ABC transporter permease [Ideonella sp.]HEX5682818.1 ABC transporter permease [Ideonella sp.]